MTTQTTAAPSPGCQESVVPVEASARVQLVGEPSRFHRRRSHSRIRRRSITITSSRLAMTRGSIWRRYNWNLEVCVNYQSSSIGITLFKNTFYKTFYTFYNRFYSKWKEPLKSPMLLCHYDQVDNIFLIWKPILISRAPVATVLDPHQGRLVLAPVTPRPR